MGPGKSRSEPAVELTGRGRVRAAARGRVVDVGRPPRLDRPPVGGVVLIGLDLFGGILTPSCCCRAPRPWSPLPATSCWRHRWSGGATAETNPGGAGGGGEAGPASAVRIAREPATAWISGGPARARGAWCAAAPRTHATVPGARRHLLADPGGRPVAAVPTPPAAVPSSTGALVPLHQGAAGSNGFGR
ncbi:hypothetical protein ACSHWO_03220 [Streptomyces sp. HUAS TT3]|uniref:hypothetical protein n=1 Tax=Streptomyces sp. HUAS TT3 TaxID=3447510 RepID=UPI003F657BF3